MIVSDITKQVEKASRLRSDWTEARVRSTLADFVSRNPGSSIDWEPGDEEWARVLSTPKGEVIAFICARLPLAFEVADEVGVRPSAGVLWISVPSMSARALCVDQAALEQAFGREVSSNLDYRSVSANDIWWATVS